MGKGGVHNVHTLSLGSGRTGSGLARIGDVFTVLIPGDPEWPMRLGDLGTHAPFALYVQGNAAVLGNDAPKTVVTEGRAATGYGEQVCMEISAGLTDRGHTILSGAAYGIDGMAHRATLASGGNTTAVLAGGLDRYYPSGHDALLQRVAETGAIVTEMPLRAAPTKWRFLQRSGLIAVLTRATVVLEAGWRSGSLNTAGHAAALGRPLGAVPGPVTSAASAGCRPAEWSLDRTDAGGPGRAGTRRRCGASGARMGTDREGVR